MTVISTGSLVLEEDKELELSRKEQKANSLWRKFCRNNTAAAGFFIICSIIFMAFFAPLISPYDPNEIELSSRFLGPLSKGHWLGTDEFGRDLLSRIMYGARASILIASGSSLLGCLIGTAIGIIAGYAGGRLDALIMRIVDGMHAFPSILLSIVLVTVLGSGQLNLILAIGISSVPGFTRLVRGQVTIFKNEEYCNAVRILGASDVRIAVLHILPNAISPVIVSFSLSIAGAILAEAGLSFLGLGLAPPTASWGGILRNGNRYLSESPHIAFVAGFFILITVLGFNLVGDGLRDALDPRMKR